MHKLRVNTMKVRLMEVTVNPSAALEGFLHGVRTPWRPCPWQDARGESCKSLDRKLLDPHHLIPLYVVHNIVLVQSLV
jgi:hypothetical protein